VPDDVILAGAAPPDFLWGTATGAHQTEGNNLASDWWEYEQSGAVAEPSGDAVDSYHRWRQDMDLAASAGLTDYRFGIEWSRIEPEDGRYSQAELDHYHRMIDGCRARGLRPFPTLHHFTLPRWFARTGGWRRPDAVRRFTRYVETLAPILAGVGHVGTINEPNIVAILARTDRDDTTLRQGFPLPDPEVSQVVIDAHHAARDALKTAHPAVRVGWGISVQDLQPVGIDAAALAAYAHPRDERFAEAARGDDWVGVQTYTRLRIGVRDGHTAELIDPAARTTMSGWEYYPDALGGAVRRIARIVGSVPIIVTENGIATADDDERITYTRAALHTLRAAMADGADVRGYLHWSLLDNYEWGDYTPTFGLVGVDRATFTRTPRPSLAWLGAQHPGGRR
jgi:beta-glucosidase